MRAHVVVESRKVPPVRNRTAPELAGSALQSSALYDRTTSPPETRDPAIRRDPSGATAASRDQQRRVFQARHEPAGCFLPPQVSTNSAPSPESPREYRSR